jgi:DNA-binding MarR family transcriptional regulator
MNMTRAIPREAIIEVRDSCLCFASQRAARRLARRFDRVFRELGLTNGQFSLMSAVSGMGDPTVGVLSDFLAMDRTTVTALLKALARRGLVAIAADKQDRRARRVSLAPAGADTLAAAIPVWRSEHARLEHELTAATAERARSALRELAR